MKNKYFKILVLSGIVLASANNTFSQVNVIEQSSVQTESKTYRIINLSNLSDLTPYEEAMEKADFDTFRFLDKRRNLEFQSGIVIELFSVNEVKELGIAIDETKATSDSLPQGYIPPTYKLSPEGNIIAMHQLNPRKK